MKKDVRVSSMPIPGVHNNARLCANRTIDPREHMLVQINFTIRTHSFLSHACILVFSPCHSTHTNATLQSNVILTLNLTIKMLLNVISKNITLT